ncbi:cupin domain-containing protein [Bdellovibrionota bacterium FG-2]
MIRVISCDGTLAITQEEAEARLHTEGYRAFRWHDVPGSAYPRHIHETDDCFWVITGEVLFTIADTQYKFKGGDHLYIPARIPHSSEVASTAGATYLVGEKIGPKNYSTHE